jgi:hypothetical protein
VGPITISYITDRASFYCMAYLFLTLCHLTSVYYPVLTVDLQMAPTVELSVDGLSYRGFAQILYDVLDKLGVPTEQVKYICRGEPRPNRL